MHKLKIRRIGRSFGVIFPQEVLSELKVTEGDEVSALPFEGGIKLAAFDPECKRGLEAFEVIQKQYRNTLRKLSE